MRKKVNLGSMVIYVLAAVFLGVAVYFATLAGTQDNAFISSELGLATLSPNGPSGGVLVPASGSSGGCAEAGGCYSQGSYYFQASYYSQASYEPEPEPDYSQGSYYSQSSYASCDANQGDSCTSSSNACGQTNSGTIQCDGSCSASAPPNNSCTPVVTLEAQIKPDVSTSDPVYNNSVFIEPGDELELSWNSDYASACDTTDLGGSSSDSTSGTLDVTPSLSPGGDINYQVTCTSSGSGGNGTDSLLATVPNIDATVFEASPDTVRRNETTTLQWQLELVDSLSATPDGDTTPYEDDCVIQGATQGDTPYNFNAVDNGGSGSITTQPIESRFVSVLTCDSGVYREAEIEVVPTANEV